MGYRKTEANNLKRKFVELCKEKNIDLVGKE
jgi:hypothetical protein